MKTAVVYKSKTGYTKQYAQWLAQELGADLFEGSKVIANNLAGYETIIYGGGVYAGGIRGVRLITKNLAKLKAKKLVVFATGASSSREETICAIRNQNFTPKQLERIKFFYIRGGFDLKKLTFPDSVLMKILQWVLKRKSSLTVNEQEILTACNGPVDFTKKENLAEIISYCQQ